MLFNNKTFLSIGYDHLQEKIIKSFKHDSVIMYDYKKIEIKNTNLKKKLIKEKEFEFYNSKYFLFKVIFFLLINPFKISYISFKILKSNNYKYFCTGSYAILLFTIIFSKIFNYKINLIYIYADWFLNYQNKKNYFFFIFNTKIFKIIEYFIHKNVNYFIFYSKELFNNYSEYYQNKSLMNKKYYLLDFIDHLKYSKKKTINKKLEINSKKIKFFFIGNLRDDTDLINFIKFLSKSKLYDFSLDIVGTGEIKHEILNLIDFLNLKNKVCLHDFINDHDLISKIANKCHFGLAVNKYVSHSSYTFPGKINSYFEHNLPIIYSSNLYYVKNQLGFLKIGYELDYGINVDNFYKELFLKYPYFIENLSTINNKLTNKLNVNFKKF